MPLILWLILGTPAVIWFLGTDMPGVTEFREAAAELIGESFGLLGERVDEFANFLQRAVRTAILALFGMVLFAMILPNQDIHWTLPLYFWHPQITIWCSRTTVIPTLVLALVGYLAWIVTRGHVLLGILAVELVPSKTPLVGKIAALGKKLLRKVQLYLGLIVVFGIVLSIVPLSNDFSLVPLFAATIIARIFLGKGKLRGILTITMVGFVLVFFMGGRGPAKKNFGKFTDSGNPADLFSADISTDITHDRFAQIRQTASSTSRTRPNDHSLSIRAKDASERPTEFRRPQWDSGAVSSSRQSNRTRPDGWLSGRRTITGRNRRSHSEPAILIKCSDGSGTNSDSRAISEFSLSQREVLSLRKPTSQTSER